MFDSSYSREKIVKKGVTVCQSQQSAISSDIALFLIINKWSLWSDLELDNQSCDQQCVLSIHIVIIIMLRHSAILIMVLVMVCQGRDRKFQYMGLYENTSGPKEVNNNKHHQGLFNV